MRTSSVVEYLPAHDQMWQTFQPILASRRFRQSILFVGSRHVKSSVFAMNLVGYLFCEQLSACGQCHQCQRLLENVHPDLHYIAQDALDKAIKIDQIRAIQQDIYQTPQRAKYRIVIIDSAERMNIAAANALLKVLEEPPVHTLFILLAEQMSSIPPTILSRCQKYFFSDGMHDEIDYLNLGKLYPNEDPRAVIFQDRDQLIQSLIDLCESKVSPPEIATRWSHYNFDDLLWWLYLVNSQMIRFHFYKSEANSRANNRSLYRLSQQIPVTSFFDYNRKISVLRKKLSQNITINQTLALEDLLLDYVRNIQ